MANESSFSKDRLVGAAWIFENTENNPATEALRFEGNGKIVGAVRQDWEWTFEDNILRFYAKGQEALWEFYPFQENDGLLTLIGSSLSGAAAGGVSFLKEQQPEQALQQEPEILREPEAAMEITAAMLLGKNWRFGEKNENPWSSSFQFLPNGKIAGYENNHEKFWHLDDGQLQIFTGSGQLTWIFDLSANHADKIELIGEFRLDSGYSGVGVLTYTPPPMQITERHDEPSDNWPSRDDVVQAEIAVLVLCASAPKIIDAVLETFNDKRFHFFLHVDAKVNMDDYTKEMKNRGRATFLQERVDIYWGGFTMIEAELALANTALQNQHLKTFVVISDDTAPLQSPDEIYQALSRFPDRIESIKDGWREGWYYSFFYPDSKVSGLRPNWLHEDRRVLPSDFAMFKRMEALEIRGKKKIPAVHFCRQWWALSRAKLEAILEYVKNDEHFVESFRFSLFPDETFFPTAFRCCFPDTPVLEVPTYSDFADYPRHPNPWIYQSLEEIAAATTTDDHLFIRKLAPERPEMVGQLARRHKVKEMAEPLEAIRLVVWDLDETFWRGTLTEGGITYVREYHDIVVELAKRGVMSSICSKNDLEPVKKILTENGLWDYFIFPSINWEPKGPRLEALVEAVQLRPPTILFIDDNALNRHEALHYVPTLQVADETVIPGLLNNALCKGKADQALTRLAQYKLLEARHQDKEAVGDNTAFLEASQIRVTIEHDLDAHIDRVVELINRTNQLNFTKKRLPENPDLARAELKNLLNLFDIQAGLVHVQDRYGDYGFIGLYVMRTFESQKSLIHFCFSCRTLGMGVEKWLYDRLGRPELAVVGEVLTDLFAEGEDIHWINVQTDQSLQKQEHLAERIFMRGGCSMSSMAHYLELHARNIEAEFNTVRSGRRIRNDHSLFLRYAFEGLDPAALQSLCKLGYAPEDFRSALTDGPGSFDACLFNFMVDVRYATYRHPTLNVRIPFFEYVGDPAANVLDGGMKEYAEEIRLLREEGYVFEPPSLERFEENLKAILLLIPDDVMLIFLLDPESYRDGQGQFHELTMYKSANQVIRNLTKNRRNVHLLEVLDFVRNPSERINADHFNRMVYYRVYEAVRMILRKAGKTAPQRLPDVLAQA